MFTTFEGSRPVQSSRGKPTKRAQVARACNWCRVHRVKCDRNERCQSCQNRGGDCIRNGRTEPLTIPRATREIERLTKRVQELEQQLQDQFRPLGNPASPGKPPSVQSLDPFHGHGRTKMHWEGVHTRSAKSDQTQYYGPSSSFYFIARVSSYLGTVLGLPTSEYYMQPNSASRSFASPTSASVKVNRQEPDITLEEPTTGDYLTEIQEEYFLGLFWHSYHCMYQILDEAEFRQHYRSLWTESGAARKPSALVDIVLALCMQYGVSVLSRSGSDFKTDVDSTDATIAGRALYRRSQSLLNNELESPSLVTLQCHIFTLIYLCNASFQNMAHNLLATAVRTAHILGLHLEPPEDLPLAQRELRRRIWWTLYSIEVKTCMKLGRPWSMQMEEITCRLPSDDRQLAFASGSNFASSGNTTWLTYSVQMIKLVMSARAIYSAFYDRCADVLTATGGKSLYANPASLETCADFLFSSMGCLESWLRDLPEAMMTKRKNMGQAFSTDASGLDIERFAPEWLQRQRVLLELLYHNLVMNMTRPFITFLSKPRSPTPKADESAERSVNHAMAITLIMHQMLTETKLLNGWHEAFQWQWNAALTMIGFIIAYPTSPTTAEVRKVIDTATAVFDIMGMSFATAANAANVTRDVTAKADFLARRAQNMQTMSPLPDKVDLDIVDRQSHSLSFADLDQELPVGLEDSMGLAFTVDSFTSFEPLYAGNLFDMWTMPDFNSDNL
ncbi:fungal-specific transcription factor domain-containing protein [Aspergillus alliaceus]|uniref:Fungal-specific transcription factor domain-containing protein n=1 Tax=Petromyces alliaceus TaxID=209559 RepID=A0A5N7CH58_PETAA|nr:fungal-specific transcription factor domain-containing protein [Aspergillus alliaceus]